MTRVFVSHSSKDRAFADELVELLRSHYLDTWYSPRDIPAGRWEPEIRRGLEVCDWFLVVLSPDALASAWVRREVQLALEDPKYHASGQVVPVLARPCSWIEMHSALEQFPLLDFTRDPEEARARLLAAWSVEQHSLPQFRVGDVLMPVYRLVGGNGKVRYRSPDGVVCNAPTAVFDLPDDVADLQPALVERQRAEAQSRGAVFENRPMVRLNNIRWGLRDGDDQPWPLRLDVGLTDYFAMRATNVSVDAKLPDGSTIGGKYGGALDDLAGSRLANPLATNLSVVTADRKIYVARRGLRVGWNPGGFAPAVSGTGSPQLDMRDGVYDPFRTAAREAEEEVTSPLTPDPSQITFFGLARTFKYRFPFLFGELRLDVNSDELESQVPLDGWETRSLVAIPFTVEGVTDWIRQRYRDQIGRRGLGPALGTTLFSLLQSLLYEYPEDWQRVVAALRFKDA